MTKLADTDTVTSAQTIIGVFDTETRAQRAISVLERAGMPPDRIGIVNDNIRQAREVAGSRSPQGALVGAMLAAILVVGYIVFGGEQVRINPVGIAIGALPILAAGALIGFLAGRSRVLKHDEYNQAEDEVEAGEVLLSVVCSTPDGADTTRAILEREGAREVRVEQSGESV